MIHSLIFLLDITTLILFILTLVKQFKLQSHYKNLNGLRYHRLAYIGITLATSLVILSRIILQFIEPNGYYTIENDPLFNTVLLCSTKLFMLIVAIFSYLWFKNSKFSFLKIFDRWI